MKFLVDPGGSMTGSLRVPGDKSMSHRTVMFGALAEGTTQRQDFWRVRMHCALFRPLETWVS